MKNNKKEVIDLTGLEVLEEKKQVVISIDTSSLSSTDTEETQWDITLERNRKRQKLEDVLETKEQEVELSDTSNSFITYSGEAAGVNLDRIGRDYRINPVPIKKPVREEEEVVFIKVVKSELASGTKLHKY